MVNTKELLDLCAQSDRHGSVLDGFQPADEHIDDRIQVDANRADQTYDHLRARLGNKRGIVYPLSV